MTKQIIPQRLLLISFLNGLVFYAPVALLIRTQAGIAISQFFTLQMILSLCIFLFEIPAGYLSDRIGYKNSIVLSQALLLAARILLLISETYWLFAMEAVIEGLSISLISGTESAYLYSYCQGEEYTVFNSKIGRAGTIGFILSTISYSLILYFTNISMLVILTCAATLISLIVSVLLPLAPSSESESSGSVLRQLKRVLPPSSRLFFWILSCISVAYLVINFFYAVKLERIHLDYEWMTAVILGYSAIELFAPSILRQLRTPHYFSAICVLLALCTLSFCGIFLLDSLFCILLMLVVPLMLSLMNYLCDELLNERIDQYGLSDHRATVLSIFNMGNNVLEIAFLALSALLSGNEGNSAFLFVAIYAGLVCICMIGTRLFRYSE